MVNAPQKWLVSSFVNEPEKHAPHDGCQYGGGSHFERAPDLAPGDSLLVDVAMPQTQGARAPGADDIERQWLAITGLVFGVFLLLHLTVNAFGLWPALYQFTAGLSHGLGAALPSLEIGLVLAPLAIHVALGLRVLRRDKLALAVEHPHRGSEMRYWLQRVTAVILLVFLSFHLATMHRWGLHLVYQMTRWPAVGRYAAGGLFVAQRAFASVSEAQWQFWSDHTANPANLLVGELYLLGIAAAVYHLANGVATGAEVLGLVTARRKDSLWRVCIAGGFVLAAIGMAGWYAFAPGGHPGAHP
jgi:succinate dehydrogenase/fumarate reductase cytochrome b subunit